MERSLKAVLRCAGASTLLHLLSAISASEVQKMVLTAVSPPLPQYSYNHPALDSRKALSAISASEARPTLHLLARSPLTLHLAKQALSEAHLQPLPKHSQALGTTALKVSRHSPASTQARTSMLSSLGLRSGRLGPGLGLEIVDR